MDDINLLNFQILPIPDACSKDFLALLKIGLQAKGFSTQHTFLINLDPRATKDNRILFIAKMAQE